jgi:PH (Pleckstrin Homology) domain-containing protein
VTEPGNDVPDGTWASFRPVRARRTALGFAVAQAVVLFVLAAVLPGAGWFDRIGFVVVAVAIGAVLLRFGLLRADPGPAGLVVRNLVHREDLRWEQIVSVRFGDGDPWVMLDLSDGNVVAVMAIQRADGARALAEARRLATLVAAGSRTPRDD